MKEEFMHWMMMVLVINLMPAKQSKAFQKDTLRTVNLRDVVVTATKFPKNQTETGKVLTVIDAEQISRSRGKDLSQLLNEQVGLVINGANSNPAKDKSVFLRGASGSYTLVLVDGIPVTDPSGVGGAFDLRMLSLDQVERIEILKGSQSTLYGTDAVAGVINIITKQKGEKPVEGFARLNYGSYGTIKANVGAAGRTELFNYHLAYSGFQTNGLSEAKDKNGAGNFDKDGFRQNTIRLNLGVTSLKKIEIKPFFQFTDFEGAYDAGAFTDDTDARYESRMINLGLNGRFAMKNGSLNVLYSTTGTERTFNESYGTFPYEGHFHHAEMFVNYDLGDHVQFLGGVNYQHFKMVDESALIKNSKSYISSPYFSFFLKSLNGLSAELGGRFVSHSVYGNNLTYSINPSYVMNKLKFFANYTTGFKTPTLSQLYGPFGANPDLEPEVSQSLEGGIQFISSNKKFDVRSTVFSRTIDQAIAYTSSYVNLNTLNDLGFELEPSLRLNKLTLTAYYAFVEGKITTETQNGSETKDNDLIRRPKHSVGSNIGYRFSDKIYASLNFKTFGKRNDLFFDIDTFTNVAVVLEPYQLLDLYAEYFLLNGKIRLFTDVRNVLNQSYYEAYGFNTQRINFTVGVHLTL